MNYRAEIDGLRALAVIPVIVFHTGFELFGGGFVGVDVFFVISGYLITTIIISEMAEGKFSIINFYERRARRILPALFFVMLVCLPFAWFWLTPVDLKDFGQSLVAVSTFSSNILFWLESGYFDTAAELKPLLHTWSLAVEEQYYILFPIFLILTWRLGLKWILSLLVIVFVISLGASHWGAFNKPSATFYQLPTRGWELLIGVFAGFYLKHKDHLKSDNLNQILSLLGFSMVVYAMIAFDNTTPFPSLYALIPTVGTVLLILTAVPKTLIHKLLSCPLIVGFGLTSYSAYVWHQPILVFARHRLLGEISDVLLILLCLSSFVMGYISWRWIEKPFRDKNKISRKRIFAYSFLGILIFSTIGLTANLQKGFLINRGSFDFDIYNQWSKIYDGRQLSIKAGVCHFNGVDGITDIDQFLMEWNCRPKEITEETIFVFGDSTSADIANALRQTNQPMVQLGGAGCSLLNDQRGYCEDIHNFASKLIEEEGIKTVVLSNHFEYNNKESRWHSYIGLRSPYLQKIFNYWGEKGLRIHVFSPPLEFENYKNNFFNWRNPKIYNRNFNQKGELFFQQIKGLTVPNNIRTVNVFELLCSEENRIEHDPINLCLHYNGNEKVFYRTDSFHFSDSGALAYGPLIQQALKSNN